MHNNFILMALLNLSLMIGFAYIIWLLASKETLPLKIFGQIISIAIIIFVILAAVLPGQPPRNGMFGRHRNIKKEMKMQGPPSRTENIPGQPETPIKENN